MDRWLEQNLEALVEAHGRTVVLPPSDSERVRIERDADRPAAFLRAATGQWRAVHSRRDPVTEARRSVARAFGGTSPSTVVLVGVGLGYVVDAVAECAPDARLIVFEPEPLLARAWLEWRDIRKLVSLNRLRLYLGPAYIGASEAWRAIDPAAEPPSIIVDSVLARELPDTVNEALRLVRMAITQATGNAAARQTFARGYLLNTIRNLPTIVRSPPVTGLKGSCAGIPAVIAGSGPSLPDVYPELRRGGDRAVLVAVDTSVRPLLAAGIEPHFAVAVDPGAINAGNFRDLPPHRRMCLVADSSVDSRVFAPFPGRTALFRVSDHEPWPWLTELGADVGMLPTFGSVVSSALHLAVLLGCDPIVFVGVDLAYTGGQPYCRGVTYEADWQKNIDDWVASGSPPIPIETVWRYWMESRPVVTSPDVRGREVETARHMEAFRDHLVDRMAVMPDHRYVNATGAGILHGGPVRQATLSEAIPGAPAAVPAAPFTIGSRPEPVGQRVVEAARTLRTAAATCGRLEQGPPPLPAWVRFAAGTLPVPDVVAALDSALAAMSSAPSTQG